MLRKKFAEFVGKLAAYAGIIGGLSSMSAPASPDPMALSAGAALAVGSMYWLWRLRVRYG